MRKSKPARVSLWAGAIMACALLSAGAAAEAGTLSSASLSVTEGGGTVRTRDYRLFTPATMPAGAPALVIVLHGGGNDANESMTGEYEGLWNSKADEREFYVVYPQGQLQSGSSDQRNWNDCRAPATAFNGAGDPTDGGMDPANARYSDWDDVAFIEQLADRFITPPMGSG
ncbi:MAG TPA: hypothetical protein VM915_00775, partial [Verrucomicrobiae bacterium]|nr:hypothetical protein [Verrucomicrobiae bacterium]